MNTEIAVDIFQNLISTSFILISPILLSAIAIGLVISLIQTVTSIQEQTLTFVPKLFGVGMVLVASANWMLRGMMEYTIEIFQRMADMGL